MTYFAQDVKHLCAKPGDVECHEVPQTQPWLWMLFFEVIHASIFVAVGYFSHDWIRSLL